MGRLQPIRARDKGASHSARVCFPVSWLSWSSAPAVLWEISRPDGKALALMLPVDASVQDVISAVGKPGGDQVLVRMNSAGGREASGRMAGWMRRSVASS